MSRYLREPPTGKSPGTDQKKPGAGLDDFEKEVEALRNSLDFQQFLDERSRSTGRISLDEIEAEIDREQR